MVYGLQGSLAFSSAARRDAVLSDMQTRISSKPRWDVDVLQVASGRQGVNAITVSLRFTVRADADDLSARVQSFATGQRAPLPGSWLTVHDCTHDEGTDDCVIVARRDW